MVASWDDTVDRVAPRELIQHDAGTPVGMVLGWRVLGRVLVMMVVHPVFGSWDGEAVHEA